jgi:RNA polymerase sigma-70 factor, ECF subfamily
MTGAAASNPADRLTERALVERARAGDAAALAEIVRQYQGPVYRAALAALRSPADAEEAAQDAFVAAFRKLETFRGDASLRTWLLAIAWRKALTRRRRRQAWRAMRLLRADDPNDAGFDQLADTAPGPEADAAGRELRRQLRVLIGALPRKLRDALLLAASGSYHYDEIAAMLGVPIGTVKWRVSEARRVLRAKLRALGYER